MNYPEDHASYNEYQDRKFSRKRIKFFIKSPRSPSPSSPAALYIRNVLKPALRLGGEQLQFYQSFFKSSQSQQNSILRSYSQKQITPINKLYQSWTTDSQKQQIRLDSNKIISQLLQQNQQLKKQNNKLVKTIQYYSLINCQCKLIKSQNIQIIKQDKNTILQQQNQQLYKQIQQLKQKNRELTQKLNKKQQISNNQILINLIKQKQIKQINYKQQNKKLKLQLNYLRNQIYKDIQKFKKYNNQQTNIIKQKYIKLLLQHKNLSKNYCNLNIKLKKYQLEQNNKINFQNDQSLSYSSCSSINKQ